MTERIIPMNAPLQKGRLGRGLASLIGEPVAGKPVLPPEGEQRVVPIADVKAGRLNPRKDFRDEELAELADSIRTKGLVQPIIVRPIAGGYEIVAGERRWRAAQKAGLHMVPVIARDLSDKEVLELAIIENVQRADLNAIEEAAGYRELIERFDYSQEQLSEIIGKSRSHVANTLRLLKLPEGVQTMVQDGRLTAGHARALINRADAEALVQDGEERSEGGSMRRVREKDADTRAFEKELASVLGLKVEIKRGPGDSGNLVIKYANYEQLDYIRTCLVGHAAG
jgi:ParB family transcriptional regulator, chromosome partitioning protein